MPIIGTLPVILTNGTVADATQVQSDLNFIVNSVNSNAADATLVALLAANNNFTVVQSGVAATAAAHFPIASQVQNSSLLTLSSTLGTNTVTGRIAQLALTAYATNQVFTFIPAQTNTGATTLNINGVNPIAVQAFGSALVGGELKQAVPQSVVYDGAAFQLLNYALPAGTILPFAGSTTPTGFILCDGAAISRTSFSNLFAAISTTWGAGDGSTTFNVPDLRGRSLFGRDNMGGTTANRITLGSSGVTGTTLGAVGGNQGVVIGKTQLPASTAVIPALSVSGTIAIHDAGAGSQLAQQSGGTPTGSQAYTGTTAVSATGALGSAAAMTTISPLAICNFVIKY